jgi:nicotinamidase-related amidase
MSSEPRRDSVKDFLLTPQNSALIIIDYQPTQVNSIKSMDHEVLVDHIVTVAKTAIAYGLPTILSTVNVQTGVNKPTVQLLLDALGNIDRTMDRGLSNVSDSRRSAGRLRCVSGRGRGRGYFG